MARFLDILLRRESDQLPDQPGTDLAVARLNYEASNKSARMILAGVVVGAVLTFGGTAWQSERQHDTSLDVPRYQEQLRQEREDEDIVCSDVASEILAFALDEGNTSYMEALIERDGLSDLASDQQVATCPYLIDDITVVIDEAFDP